MEIGKENNNWTLKIRSSKRKPLKKTQKSCPDGTVVGKVAEIAFSLL
jgi:hypothetical protein